MGVMEVIHNGNRGDMVRGPIGFRDIGAWDVYVGKYGLPLLVGWDGFDA